MSVKRGKKEVVRLLKKSSGDKQSPERLQFAVGYLSFFGYLGIELLSNVTSEDIEKAVKAFQKWWGLKADGVVGDKTLRAMETPRCGCPDKQDSDNPDQNEYNNMQALVLENQAKWNKCGLKYSVQGYVTGKIPKAQQKEIIKKAWGAWNDVCGIHVEEVRHAKDADIVIKAEEGTAHKFDGRGGTLAWAYLPTGNDEQLAMKFDLAETWIANPRERGILMYNVAVHEFGHLLGLTHSKVSSAIMAPYYNPVITRPQENDDISRARKLYGPNIGPVSSLTKPARKVVLQPGEDLLVVCE